MFFWTYICFYIFSIDHPKICQFTAVNLQLSYVSHLQLPGSLAQGAFSNVSMGWPQSPVAMKEFLNHIIWWLGYTLCWLYVGWMLEFSFWKMKTSKTDSTSKIWFIGSLPDPTSHQFRWSCWETLERDSPQLGRTKPKPSKNRSMDAIATSEKNPDCHFLPKRTTKKTPPDNRHRLEDNEP